jgi:diguanylate cyclase (GGDEF)-like protein
MPLPKFSDLSLQWKVMTWITFAQLTLSVAVFFAVVHQSDNALKTSAETGFQELDTVMSTALVDPLLQRDYALLQRLTDELLKSKTVEGMQIANPLGITLAQSGVTEIPRDSRQIIGDSSSFSESFSWGKSAIFYKTSKIQFAGQPLAVISYSISLAQQLKARSKLLEQFFAITVLMTLLALVAGFFLTAKLVARIKDIGRISQAAIGGDYSSRANITSNDELGRLAQDFNRLSESVGDRINELTESETLRSFYLNSSQQGEARLKALLNSMKLGIVMLDTQQNAIYKNDALLTIWPEGVPASVLISEANDCSTGFEIEIDNARIVSRTIHSVYETKISYDTTGESSGKMLGKILGKVLVFEDITAERNSQKTIQFLAERDSLTGLYNRRSFTQALHQALETNPGQALALAYIDLDNFKLVNDIKGHKQGDKVLIDIANKILSATRSNDIVARLGGDEFVILATDISLEAQTAWCDRLLLQLSAPDASAEGGVNMVSSSVGIAWYPKDAQSADQLLAAADTAMYTAKRAGKNAWRSFQKDADRAEHKANELLWNSRVNEALQTDGFEIFLQGVHHADSREIHHYEALIRMPDRSRQGQFHQPGEFITFAESSGKIAKIDRWMISHSVRLLALNPNLEPIAVNVSALSMGDSWLPSFVRNCLNENGVNATRLHLELTETAALADISGAQATVIALKQLGCEVCLDDFGSGFTSLAYLKLINASYLKIDGLFMRDLEIDRENQVLLRAIVDIASSSGKLTVAEWIEDEDMLQTALRYKIDLVQGYHLSRPLPAAQVVASHGKTLSTALG